MEYGVLAMNSGEDCTVLIFPWVCRRATVALPSANVPYRGHGGIPPGAKSGRRKVQFPHPLDAAGLDPAVS